MLSSPPPHPHPTSVLFGAQTKNSWCHPSRNVVLYGSGDMLVTNWLCAFGCGDVPYRLSRPGRALVPAFPGRQGGTQAALSQPAQWCRVPPCAAVQLPNLPRLPHCRDTANHSHIAACVHGDHFTLSTGNCRQTPS